MSFFLHRFPSYILMTQQPSYKDHFIKFFFHFFIQKYPLWQPAIFVLRFDDKTGSSIKYIWPTTTGFDLEIQNITVNESFPMRYVRSVLFRRYRNSGWFGRQDLQNDLSIFQDFVSLTLELIYSIYIYFLTSWNYC